MKRLFLLIALSLLLIPGPGAAKSTSHPLKVIATFSILGDFAKQVGGNQVQVYSLVGPDATAYDYKPTDGDRISVERSDLVISNGLGLEGWLAPLLQGSNEQVRVMQAAYSVQPRYAMGGGIDPHAWMSVTNAMQYVQNICNELVAVDPENATYYKDNADAYIYQLKKLDHAIKLQIGRLPAARRAFVINHDSFAYFAAAYGMTILPIQRIEMIPHASASDNPDVPAMMKKRGISMLFDENVGGGRVIDEMKELTGGSYGGRLYAAALSEDESATSYIDMMKTDVDTIYKALLPPKDSGKAR